MDLYSPDCIGSWIRHLPSPCTLFGFSFLLYVRLSGKNNFGNPENQLPHDARTQDEIFPPVDKLFPYYAPWHLHFLCRIFVDSALHADDVHGVYLDLMKPANSKDK